MPLREIEYIDPIPENERRTVPARLRLKLVGALLLESLTYPLGKSYLQVDVENNKIIVQRVRKTPKEKDSSLR